MTRVLAAVLASAALALAACSQDGPSFKATDVTGAEFGREFALTGHDGRPRTLADFRGKAVVVFFGFTHCPDVCPTALSTLAEAKKKLGADGERVQGVFITVDPERDTPELLRNYVPAFDPAFVGLYGDAAATQRVAKEFKVLYRKVPGSTPDTYTMDHSAGMFVFDPQGRLRLYVGHGTAADALAQDLRTLLASSG
ncbi:MAG: photosynthetic protein synthase I [Betaproteobacteria bacterium]|nr:MAG: photosynthetic protein synthase I [Betaproteobacteria bacterium]